MSMPCSAAVVEPFPTGRQLHARLLMEARTVLDAVLNAPAWTPEELAAVLDGSTGGALDEVTLSVLVEALTG
jgi:hypothetical protein